MKNFVSRKAHQFTESVIREMTRLAQLHGAVNLAQGFPDFPAPALIKEKAAEAIHRDVNQYAITWGAKSFRDALAAKWLRFTGQEINPEAEITVCCGSTEAMIAAILAVVDPGEEVIIFEPFYENYGPDAILSGAEPRFVTLRPPGWTFDPAELRAAFTPRTKAIIVNTPNNPTGKVFTREELQVIAGLCQEFDALAITDEIYEHITYEGHQHVPLATLPGMRERTITINGMSKTYSVTGWRVGYCIAPPNLTGAIRKVHDFLTVGAAAPLQEAGAAALAMPDSYYRQMAVDYERRRDTCLRMLADAGFECFKPYGAYYIMTDIGRFGFADDVKFTRFLIEKIGVAAVPGSSFFRNPADGRRYIRFCYCKKDETLQEAARRLSRLQAN